MPIGEGAFVDVLVTHVVSPEEIYVQKVNADIVVVMTISYSNLITKTFVHIHLFSATAVLG